MELISLSGWNWSDEFVVLPCNRKRKKRKRRKRRRRKKKRKLKNLIQTLQTKCKITKMLLLFKTSRPISRQIAETYTTGNVQQWDGPLLLYCCLWAQVTIVGVFCPGRVVFRAFWPAIRFSVVHTCMSMKITDTDFIGQWQASVIFR